MLQKTILFCAIFLCCVVTATAQCPASSAPAPARKIVVSPEVLSRGLQKENLPVYPDAALRQKIHGQVTLHVLVDETGQITRANILHGDPAISNAALVAVCGFQFRPYLLNGRPLAVDSQMIFDFAIKGHGNKARGRVEYVK